MAKPLLTINNWSGMSNEGGTYYLEGWGVNSYNGIRVLEDAFSANKLVDLTDTGWTNLSSVRSMDIFPSDSAGNKACYLLTEDGRIYAKNYSANYSGELHHIRNTGTDIWYPDLLFTAAGNMIYASGETHIGKGYMGYCKTTSATTIIDAAGRNWTTLGIDPASDYKNKVTNLKTGIEYTVTSISTTDATNDTLNFSAGAITNTANDYFIVWDDTLFTCTSTTFGGMRSQYKWPKSIKQYGDEYYATNGNYLFKLSSDETTNDDEFKQLPYRHLAMSMDVNGSKILVSADFDGAGVLLLWDGYSDGWNNSIPIDVVAECVYAYKNGWLYMINNTLYYTDGWQTQKLSTYPDMTPNTFTYDLTAPFNGITSFNDCIFVASNSFNFNRMICGIAIFNPAWGWSVVPSKYKDKLAYEQQALCVYSFPEFTAGYLMFANPGNVNAIDNYNAYASTTTSKSFIVVADLKDVQKISYAEVRYMVNPQRRGLETGASSRSITMTLSIGDAHSYLQTYFETKNEGTPTTTTFILDDTTWPYIEVGNEIQSIEVATNNISGERSFITGISGSSGSKTVTVSPAFSAAPSKGYDFRVIKVQKSDTKTLTYGASNEPVRYDISGQYSDKIFIEVVVTGTATPFPISIIDIKLYA